MERNDRQRMEEVLLRGGYTKMFCTYGRNERIFYRKFLTETLKILVKPNGNDLCNIEYSSKQIKPDGIHINESNLTSVDFKLIISKIDEYERLVFDLTKNKNNN